MQNTLCLITAQYYENYSDTVTPYWKAKGSQTFNLMVDADAFMYAEKECIKAIETLLVAESNDHCKFTYVVHELIFSTPRVLDAKKFGELVTAECEKGQ